MPEDRIRERDTRRRENLIRPRLLLRYFDGRASLEAGLTDEPTWAKPVVAGVLDQGAGRTRQAQW